MYDYIIVGAGLYGKLMAYKLSHDNKILLIDKNDISKKRKLSYIILSNKNYVLLKQLIININNFAKKENIIINKKITKTKYIINLKKLEDYLISEIEKNKAKILDKVIINKYNLKSNYLVILNKKYKYKKLIAADGTMSEIRLNLTHNIQKFNLITTVKSNKADNLFKIDYNIKNKTMIEILTIRNSNYIKIINRNKINNNFLTLSQLKKIYNLKYKKINCYFIPNNDILNRYNNVFFIGDASGMIDPISYSTLGYNLRIMNNNSNKNITKIKKEIKYKKILANLLYLRSVNKFAFYIISKIYEEDL